MMMDLRFFITDGMANEHVCFVSVEEQWEDERPRRNLYKKIYNEVREAGYSKEKCLWKNEKVRGNKITVTKQYENYEPTRFVMERKRWL